MGLNLMDTVKELNQEGFDVETSPISDFERTPDGVYEAAVTAFEFTESKNTGTQWFRFVLQILTGGQEGKKYYANLWLSDKSIKRTVKALKKYAWAMSINLDDGDFADTDSLVEKMQDAIGLQITLTLETSGKGKDAYQNWELSF